MTNSRKSLFAGIVLGTGMMFAGLAEAATFNISAVDDGWYSNTGNHNPSNNNNITGDNGALDYNSFYAFDLAALSGQNVLSVTVNFSADGQYRSADPSETLGLFDVTTPISTLINGTGGTSAYSDLGSGTSFGTFEYISSNFPMRAFSVALNSAAVSSINALLSGSGTLFGIGSSLLSLDSDPSSVETLFSSSSGGNRATASLTIETGTLAPVPLPATFLLLLAGIGGLGAFARHSKKS